MSSSSALRALAALALVAAASAAAAAAPATFSAEFLASPTFHKLPKFMKKVGRGRGAC